LVGIKPTVGLLSRSGIIPISATQDTAGPICRSVEDAAILLTALTGVDPRDPASRASASLAGTDYTSFLDHQGLRAKRLGVPRKVFTGYHDATDRLFEEALDAPRPGATIGT
jgi:amidase